MTTPTDAPSSTPGSTVSAPRPLTTADVAGFQDRQARSQSSTAYRVAQGADDRSTAAMNKIRELEAQVADLLAAAHKQGEEQVVREIQAGLDSGELTTAAAVVKLTNYQLEQLPKGPPAAPADTTPARTPQAGPTPMQIGVNTLLIAHGLRGDEQGLNLDTTTPRTTLASILNYHAAQRAAGSGNGGGAPAAPDRDGGTVARPAGTPVRVEEVDAIANQSGSRGAKRPMQAVAELKALRAQMPNPTGNSFLADE